MILFKIDASTGHIRNELRKVDYAAEATRNRVYETDTLNEINC